MSEHYEYTVKPLKALKPYEFNPNSHSQLQIDKLKQSITEFGFTNPILINEHDEIIAGHARYDAANQLKYKNAPCIVVTGLTEEKRKALVIADNRLAYDSHWDEEMLVRELNAMGDAMQKLTGFSEDELAMILKPPIMEPGKTNAEDEWSDMPDYESNDLEPYRSLKIHFRNREDFDAFLELVDQSVTDKTKYLWYPAEPRADMMDYEYLPAEETE